MRILIVEDDRDLVALLTFVLERGGFEVLAAFNPAQAFELFEKRAPDLVLLDINLGSESGLDLLQEIRRRSRIPVIMLTALGTEDDKVRGLELGADDYITKPFSHRELVARVRAQIRRGGEAPEPVRPIDPTLQVGPLRINADEYSVSKEGQRVDLSATEFRLLHYLATNAGRVVPTRTILKDVWGYDDPGGTDVVRVTVHRLRRKIEDDPSHPQLVHLVPGVGVMLKPE